MDTAAPSASTPAPVSVSPLRWLAGTVPTVVVLAILGGAAYRGHTTGWNFTRKSGDAVQARTEEDAARPAVRFLPGDSTAEELPLPGRRARIEFGPAGQVDAAAIGITPAWRTALTEQVTAAGEVQFDPSLVAKLSPRAGGVAWRVHKAAGDTVRAGDVLAHIESAEVGRAKAEFQQALVQTRLREKTRDDLVSAKAAKSPAELREAEAALKESAVRVIAAAQALTNLGLPVKPEDYRGLAPAEAARRMRHLGADDAGGTDTASASSNLLPLRAPFAGVVLSADVVAGEVVEAGKVLFVVVDPSRVWVTLNLGPEDAGRVTVGLKVFFRPDGSPREHPASVVWIGPAADETTRTLPVRAAAENNAGALRASSLGRGKVVLREEPAALVVPHAAVHTFQGRALVFVRDPDFLKPTGPKAFHARVVKTGGRDDRHAEILAGLAAGDIVATTGSAALLEELETAAR